jgi:hypothetical protein
MATILRERARIWRPCHIDATYTLMVYGAVEKIDENLIRPPESITIPEDVGGITFFVFMQSIITPQIAKSATASGQPL